MATPRLQASHLDLHDHDAAEKTAASVLDRKALVTLTVLLLGFLCLQVFLPLKTCVQIGADEGYELAKAMLCLKGHRLYSEVWNDQPPLHTFIITQVLKHITPSVLGPRLVTTAFTLLLLASLFVLVRQISGLLAAALAAALLIFSPGFLTLGSSCMLEIPALSMALAALAVLSLGNGRKWFLMEILSGILFGLSFEIKLVPIILLPIAVLMICVRNRETGMLSRKSFLRMALALAGLAISFVVTDLLVDKGAFLAHFQQSWASHFGGTKSLEYGSPADHPFEWFVLLRNWDTTIPAVIGIVFAWRQAPKQPVAILPVVWLAAMLVVFGFHRPWWSYYYIHLSIPLCWCAAIGIEASIAWAYSQRRRISVALLAVFAQCAVLWMAGRVYVQIESIQNSRQLYAALVLKQIEPYKPFVQWMYSEEPIYYFHAGIPSLPDLGVLMLKRLWSGDMTNARINSELETFQPGILLLENDSNVRSFQQLLIREYRLIYQDGMLRLYVHRSIVNKVDRSTLDSA